MQGAGGGDEVEEVSKAGSKRADRILWLLGWPRRYYFSTVSLIGGNLLHHVYQMRAINGTLGTNGNDQW